MSISRQSGVPAVTHLILWLVLGLLSWITILAYTNSARLEVNETMAFQSGRPFAYRVLAPAAARLIAAALPEAAVQAAEADPGPLGRAVHRIAPGSARYGLAALLLLFASLLSALAGMDHLAASVGIPPLRRTPALGMLCGALLTIFTWFAYLYDLPTLALFTWALALMQRGRYRAYLVLFSLACLSKETAILLIPLYWWSARHDPHAGYSLEAGNPITRRVMQQAAIFVAVKAGLLAAFADRPGGSVQFYLPLVLNFMLEPVILAFHASLLLIVFLACRNWSAKPVFLRRALVCILPPLAVLYFFFGIPSEVRVFMEAAPVILLLLVSPGQDRTQAMGAGAD